MNSPPLPAQDPYRHVTAVVIGAAIGNGLSYAVLFALGLVFLWVLAWQGVPVAELYARAYASTPYLLFAHVVGFACLLPGGVWASKLSASSHHRNALLAGLLVAFLGVLANLLPYELPIPLWSRVATVFLPVLAFPLGARLHKRAG